MKTLMDHVATNLGERVEIVGVIGSGVIQIASLGINDQYVALSTENARELGRKLIAMAALADGIPAEVVQALSKLKFTDEERFELARGN